MRAGGDMRMAARKHVGIHAHGRSRASAARGDVPRRFAKQNLQLRG